MAGRGRLLCTPDPGPVICGRRWPIASKYITSAVTVKRQWPEEDTGDLAGLGALGLRVTTICPLVFGVVGGLTMGVICAAIVLVIFTVFWVLAPSVILRRDRG